MARALIGLGEPAMAARLLSPLTRSAGSPGQLLELLITADEADHDFGAAVTAAQRLGQLGGASYPDGDALIPVPFSGAVDSLDDPTLPLSFGVGQMAPLSVELILPGGAGGSVQDLSFIPEYRDDLSKPLPPRWSISQLQQPVPAAAAGLLVLVTLGLGLARATGHGRSAWSPGRSGCRGRPFPSYMRRARTVLRCTLAAPITLAALSALLFVESVWLHTPVTESWAVAALIMSASTLLPVGPLDGAQLGKAGVLAAAGVVGGALLVGLGLI